MKINEFIKKRPHLIWYTKNYDKLSSESIVEATLNYGNWDDVQTLIKILGMKKTADIFRRQVKQKRCNYHKKSKHYFSIYFKQHAHA
ncbi:MAG: hypothetical protein Q8L47_05460 [bacterium]|nr:hypothetical protein [bacterium]